MGFRAFSLFVLSLILTGCGADQSKTPELKEPVQADLGMTRPGLMIIPSDGLLKRLKCLTETDNLGVTAYLRDYKKALIKDNELRFLIASIEELFAEGGYPIENMEQQLKQIDNDNANDLADYIEKDSKTLLMNTVKPDFVLELDYSKIQDPDSRNPKFQTQYILSAIDVYTNKTIASISENGVTNPAASAVNAVRDDIKEKSAVFFGQLNKRFSDINKNGAEITLRINIETGAGVSISEECLGEENYADFINKWLKSHSTNQSYKQTKNTAKELRFTNIRIPSRTVSGEKYMAYDFANDLRKDLAAGCGIIVQNRTQGIGDAYLTIKGLK